MACQGQKGHFSVQLYERSERVLRGSKGQSYPGLGEGFSGLRSYKYERGVVGA
jgi:hypothetical protein